MASSSEWSKRVAAWRASGMSADAFAAGRGFASATLRWWSSRLKSDARSASTTNQIRIAQVVRAPRPAARGVIIELRGARVLVPPGVDRATLASVLAVLGVAS